MGTSRKDTPEVNVAQAEDSPSEGRDGLHRPEPDHLRRFLDSRPDGTAARSVRAARRSGSGEGAQPRRDGRGDAVGDRRLPVAGRRFRCRTSTRCARTGWRGRCSELRSVPESRRAGEWLARLRPVDVKRLWEAAFRRTGGGARGGDEGLRSGVRRRDRDRGGRCAVRAGAQGLGGPARPLAARGVPGRAVVGGSAVSRRRPGDAELADAAGVDGRDGAGGDAGVAAGGQRPLQGTWFGSARRAAGTTRSA